MRRRSAGHRPTRWILGLLALLATGIVGCGDDDDRRSAATPTASATAVPPATATAPPVATTTPSASRTPSATNPPSATATPNATGSSTASPSSTATPEPVRVDAGDARTVQACETVVQQGAVTGTARAVRWAVVGPELLALEADGATVTFRAPAVARPTTVQLRLRAEDADGVAVSDDVQLVVEPFGLPAGTAVGIARDCAPFEHGVASGDPLPDGVVLWTRLTPAATDAPATVAWEVAENPAFSVLIANGETVTDAARDYTVGVEVGGLEPDRIYYYRFRDAAGQTSRLGRTRTAPAGATARAVVAVASCSSIYSGFFNAYRRIAERSDVQLVIHLGDYIYDFIDENEQLRIPMAPPVDPRNLDEWRAIHAYYLTDPDLRAARAAHPWMVIWDNHDLEANAPGYNGSLQAFREWNPLRLTDPARPEIAYRAASYGDLLDVIMLDTLLWRNRDTVPGSAEPSILGNEQFAWLEQRLLESQAAWRLLGSQKLLATVRVDPDLVEIFDGQRREVFDLGTWDGFPADRTRLFELLAAHGIDDNVVISGDAHVSVVMDLVDNPVTPPYDPNSSGASVGVEILPTSISRGNFDEALGPQFPPAVYDAVVADTLARNPHHLYLELTRHGYGVLDITAERVEAQIWYSDILAPADEETLGGTFVVRRGTNRWERP